MRWLILLVFLVSGKVFAHSFNEQDCQLYANLFYQIAEDRDGFYRYHEDLKKTNPNVDVNKAIEDHLKRNDARLEAVVQEGGHPFVQDMADKKLIMDMAKLIFKNPTRSGEEIAIMFLQECINDVNRQRL